MGEWVQCELTSADIPGVLTVMNQNGYELRNAVQTGEMTVRFLVPKGCTSSLSALLERRGDRLRILRRLGLRQRLEPWVRHPLLLSGIGFLLALTVWLPTRVFFIRVEGNERLPSGQILEQAEACGIAFGAQRREIRSEKVKNALLEAMPELQWVGVNTAGCVATVSVRERSLSRDGADRIATEIVAARDGVIRSCTVVRGTALCAPGQAVRAGEVLISGLTDCGLAILADRAEGEVFGETSRQILTRTADNGEVRVGITRETKKISLLIGKKRINFDNDSGILDGSCVKMYSEYYMTLPGGFQLPLGIAVETEIRYETVRDGIPDAVDVLERGARNYVLSHMTAGQILEERTVPEGNRLLAHYICLEMIGQNRYEEFTEAHGENDGENG